MEEALNKRVEEVMKEMPTGEDEFASANRQFFLVRQFFSVQIVERFKVRCNYPLIPYRDIFTPTVKTPYAS